jgi:hypothetical protein
MQYDTPERQITLVVVPPSDPFLDALRGRLAVVHAPEALRARIASIVARELGKLP